jgi:hypothetical protein
MNGIPAKIVHLWTRKTERNYVMTPTLTQSGLLAVLLQRQRYRVIQLAHVAAVVAGNGSREHTVDPNSPVYTLAEVKKNKAPMVTGTLEHGFVFVLLSDTQANGRYEALVYMSRPESGAPKGLGTAARASAKIHGWDTAPTPSGFAEVVSDDFPIPHVNVERGCFS